ncbi:tetratricopeptide repeat protein [Micromonospora sp. D93]|uniref:ATP-binding protein n=1 Tax=Micromonospora sp. D93 TaxID=2824886 RepID=UPI001B363487|nr:tetratricopeptide repeat protein [Micromonospora sp. D93]MBQ1019794.1 tetratricopeptide repeat protein [Micromonospora sp. D93]
MAIPTANPFAVPRQLPTSSPIFVGRGGELSQLDQLATHPQDDQVGQMAVISAIAGTGGVGKTYMAIHWAHRNQHQFPDGQLYVNLRGYYPDAPPRDPNDVLGDFLRSLGVGPGILPETTEARASMFRTIIAGRKMLLLLDNARTASQVRPLLPGQGDCFVLITSRDSLAGLTVREGAVRIDLGILTAEDSVALLKQTIGKTHFSASDLSLERLATLCGRLPLALRIAAERVTRDPNIGIDDLILSLARERDRLDMFATVDDDPSTALKSVFDWSYKALPPQQSRAFRLLALHPGAQFRIEVAAALTGQPISDVRRLVQALAAASLLEHSSAPDTYQFHDLVRAFAVHCVEEHETEDGRRISRQQECLWYVNATDSANRSIYPFRTPIDLRGLAPALPIHPFATFEDALRWFDFERGNLIYILRTAAELGMHDVVWKMATAAWSYYELRKYRRDWIESHELGLVGAKALGSIRGECRIRDNLGIAYREDGRLADAAACLEEALERWRDTGFTYGEAATLDNLGCVYMDASDLARSIRYFDDALILNRQLGDRWGEARVINNIGRARLRLGEAREATENFTDAAAIYRELNDRVGEGRTVANLGRSLTFIGDYDGAAVKLTYSRDLQREIGDRYGEAETLGYIAEIAIQQGRPSDAIKVLRHSMSIFRELGDANADITQARIDELERP